MPLVGGVSFHFRMSGIAGLTLEYDFNRIASTPAPTDLRIRSLHFVPNLRVAAVVYLYRWRMLAPFILGGAGIDIQSTTERANLQVGAGLEVTFWHHRIALVAEARAFLPLPADAERLKERTQISGGIDEDISTKEIYSIFNALFTLSVRFYY